MQIIELPMRRRGNSNSLQLADILAVIHSNDLIWSMLDFYGVGHPPGGMTMAEFEERVRASASGYRMSWFELKAFANDLEQTYDCTIVAVDSEEDLRAVALDLESFERCRLMIRAFDSTKWEVGVDPNLEGMACVGEALNALR